MRVVVAFGIVAAMVGAGCALETGDPGGVNTTGSEVANEAPVGKVRTTTPPPAPTTPITNPEPSPWQTDDINQANSNPEPSPWQPEPIGPGGVSGPDPGAAANAEGEAPTVRPVLPHDNGLAHP
jgi:hypothetical protein